MASALLRSRVRHPTLLQKLRKPEELIDLFPHNAYIGWSGFTGVGYPKMVPTALADYVEKNNLQGKRKYNLFVGASAGADTENRWAQLNMIERRSPHQVGRDISKGINNGNINFFDKHLNVPPYRQPYMITKPEDRIGTPYIPVDPSKIVAVVEANYMDKTEPVTAPDETSRAIAVNIVEFLKHEVKHGRLPENLLPIQSGIGNIANAVVAGLNHGGFKHLKVWTEVLQDSFLDLIDDGSVDFATATSVRFSPDGFERFYKGYDTYLPKLLLRSQQVSNSPEIIKRLGCIGMNTPVEVDIYAHANSTNVMGSRMLHGLGGSADFLRNSKYSIMHTPSARKSKTDPTGVSCIVPFATHIDQTEHDLDVVVTEQGLADVRGLSPRERARVIINKCAHPDYKPILTDYLDRAEFECLKKGMGHEPHLLFQAFKMHQNLAEKGTMKIDSWE
ncbi:Acetyl-CoA hydrolase/transferase [Ascosphaera apis ARSEF 7405]|uniref:Acetyl-CoA hydrolase n=1 Tax=Ascosphaera apis ARSEF 7405 TaxID=392613 RepID=A0A166P1M8_9EURO|nr:Acetyl-CoA hydrolase/transferase [Ascosphaera apis ARSEF 7405]